MLLANAKCTNTTSYTHVAAVKMATRQKNGSIREGAKRKVKEKKKMALSGQEIKGIRPIVYEQGEQYGEAEQAQPFLNHHAALPARRARASPRGRPAAECRTLRLSDRCAARQRKRCTHAGTAHGSAGTSQAVSARSATRRSKAQWHTPRCRCQCQCHARARAGPRRWSARTLPASRLAAIGQALGRAALGRLRLQLDERRPLHVTTVTACRAGSGTCTATPPGSTPW